LAVPENEVLTLALGLGMLVLGRLRWCFLRREPGWQLLLLAYVVLLLAWVSTVLEAFFWPEFLNALEHSCYLASSILAFVWCFRFYERTSPGGER
jgi:hypothetical protein